jgi:hypothetical protein
VRCVLWALRARAAHTAHRSHRWIFDREMMRMLLVYTPEDGVSKGFFFDFNTDKVPRPHA